MIEYLYDVIRASAGQPFGVTAKLSTEDNKEITTECNLNIFDEDEKFLFSIPGVHLGAGVWRFDVAAEKTKGFKGKYFYCISNEGVSLCFRKPIYLK